MQSQLAASLALAAGIAAAATAHAQQVLSYEGTWNNTTFGSSGPASLTTAITGTGFQAVFDLDNGPNGVVFGQTVDPGPITMLGSLDSSGAITFDSVTPNPHPVYGPLTIAGPSITNLSIGMPDIPSAALLNGTMTGGLQGNGQFHFDYQVNFTGGGNALGTVTLTPIPEPATLALTTVSCLLLRRKR